MDRVGLRKFFGPTQKFVLDWVGLGWVEEIFWTNTKVRVC